MISMLLAASVICQGEIFYARGVPICIENRIKPRREVRGPRYYIRQRTKYTPIRKPVNRHVKPFSRRISDVRSHRARRKAAMARYSNENEREALIERIRTIQKKGYRGNRRGR